MRTDLTAPGVPNARALIETAQAMVASGKGLLAMDESTGTCDKRFASAGIAQTVAMRRAWRELQLTAPGLAECISGVILHDQSLHQRTADGTPFVQVGLFAGASGNPALPRWLGSRAMALFFTPKSENERYTRQIRNAAGIAVFVSAQSDRAHWVEAGRCYERFALQATALGIRCAFLNQPFDDAGLITSAHADARGAGVGKDSVMLPWECSVCGSPLREGIRAPSRGEAAGLTSNGRRPHFVGGQTALAYEFAPSAAQ